MIHIRFNCLSDILDCKNIRGQDHVVKQIKANALNAWQHRQKSETSVRFVTKISDRLFRHLSVTDKSDGSLLVYR
ncbi:hemophilus-specific protein [Mannheimia haemolytica]